MRFEDLDDISRERLMTAYRDDLVTVRTHVIGILFTLAVAAGIFGFFIVADDTGYGTGIGLFLGVPVLSLALVMLLRLVMSRRLPIVLANVGARGANATALIASMATSPLLDDARREAGAATKSFTGEAFGRIAHAIWTRGGFA